MLELRNIKKTYHVGSIDTRALDGISVSFRQKEFVAILGTSGSGKTTCLNIIGGLDRYDEGDLIIKGKSTKNFKDSDWDAYRNNSVGFVFQSYNLIPHLSIVANVEMSMTLSGVPAKEKHKRALEVLERVGLSEHLHKKPSQLSGGQTQRVAIARALVNDPEILLCDEPTGALDTATSTQIMDLIKELSSDRLVIMVTHNPDIAERYADRIVRFEDGRIINDTNSFESEEKEENFKLKKTKMSFITALNLSFKNLMTKKGRTFMVSFAGSIGIIGIALILSLSHGVDAYIARVEEETLSSYPLTIEESAMDMSAMLSEFADEGVGATEKEEGKIYSNNMTGVMLNAMADGVTTNNMVDFKEYLDSHEELPEYISSVEYGYSTPMNIYRADTENGLVQVNPSPMMELMYKNFMTGDGMSSIMGSSYGSAAYSNINVWKQLIDNEELLDKQYEVIAGRMPEAYNEVVLMVSADEEISDFTLYTLGIKDQEEVSDSMDAILKGESVSTEVTSYTYEELMGNTFKLLVNSDYFEYDEKSGLWVDKTKDKDFIKEQVDEVGVEIKIVGIAKPAEGAIGGGNDGQIGYTAELTEYLLEKVNDSKIVKEQKADKETNVFTGLEFPAEDEVITMETINAYIAVLPEEQGAQYQGMIAGMKAQGMTDEMIAEQFAPYIKEAKGDATYESNIDLMGVSDAENPSTINIYPKDFEAKEEIVAIIEAYNAEATEEDTIKYTDFIGVMMSSVTTIINAISYILIAFVSISLVVSSIMIGIITYISVLERTKEIGILRAIGASKRDISRVFNAETIIVGFVAGAIGILTTIILNIPINMVIKELSGIGGLSKLPWQGAIILVVISIFLTFIAGLFPSGIAAKKDPVIALRSE